MRPTGELTTISLHFHIDHTSSVITLHCTSKNATYSATEDPPDHTIIIEANIRASDKEKSVSLDNFWRHRILTSCGDDRVTRGNSHVDPALCMYYGAKFICVMDNSGLRERVPRGNGTMCRFRSIKLKPGATSIRIKYFHGRKVTTVNAKDVQYMECEVIDNSSHIKQLARRIKELSMESRPDKRKIRKLHQQMEREQKSKVFHLEPITTTTNVKCSVNKETPPLTFKTKMTQFPINLADAVTGHKLQGRTLDKIIITGWGHSFKNWEYTVLSRVKTRAGLFLLEELDLDKSYGASEQFIRFIERLKKIENKTLNIS